MNTNRKDGNQIHRGYMAVFSYFYGFPENFLLKQRYDIISLI